MSSGSRVLRPWYTLFLPLVWLATCVASFRHPGDEYGLWVAGSLAGVWITWFVGQGEPARIMLYGAVTGTLTMGVLGYAMDRLRCRVLPWLALWGMIAAVLIWLTTAQYPTWERAIARNGSLAAYGYSALNFGLSASSLAMVLVTGIVRACQRLLQDGTRGSRHIAPQ